MRWLILCISVSCVACVGTTSAIAQAQQWGQAEDEIPPYHTHIDRRHGHDHVYPDRGAVIREVARGAATVNYAGMSFRFEAGVWYQRLGPAYVVVAPPIGVTVPQLPAFATSFDSGGTTYLYANDVFYRPRPDLGGYEVVNDPEDVVPQSPQAASGTPSSRLASASPIPKAAQDPVRSAVQPKSPAVPPPSPSPAPAAAPTSVSSIPINPTGVAISPHNGQSADQQALDRYECYQFAVAKTGFDPLASNSGVPPAETARHDADYSRAQASCLEGRGYSLPAGPE